MNDEQPLTVANLENALRKILGEKEVVTTSTEVSKKPKKNFFVKHSVIIIIISVLTIVFAAGFIGAGAVFKNWEDAQQNFLVETIQKEATSSGMFFTSPASSICYRIKFTREMENIKEEESAHISDVADRRGKNLYAKSFRGVTELINFLSISEDYLQRTDDFGIDGLIERLSWPKERETGIPEIHRKVLRNMLFHTMYVIETDNKEWTYPKTDNKSKPHNERWTTLDEVNTTLREKMSTAVHASTYKPWKIELRFYKTADDKYDEQPQS